ncbi:PadR family transcriptional regulator [Nitratireductor soli]|uniref:PadR family transcriptional regulator n=1 Tax=Nitratireductor soli TaxID=1670619 RepID=UPI00065E6CC4|nr:PadR family transcriptional regulator [Nitratireductor soli]
MSTIRLLVLGAVRRRGRAHGYQVRSDLEAWGAHEWSTAAPGSIYHALKSMAAQGLLREGGAENSAAGPPKTEYELTEGGEEAFFGLLRDALCSHDQRLDLLGAAVGFIDELSRPEALDLLRIRAQAMEQWKESIVSHLPPDVDLRAWGPVGEVIGLWLHTAESRYEWTNGLIARLEKGAHRMKGDP